MYNYNMKSMNELAQNDYEAINEELDRNYDELIGILEEAKAKHRPIDEGMFSALLGGAAAAGFGPAVMRAICNALGIDERGPLGNLMCSRLILGTVGATMG